MPLEGNLNYQELADLLKVIELSGKTGILDVGSSEGKGKLFFEEGKLVRAESDRFSVRLGDVLVERGVIVPEQVERALKIQVEEGGERRLGDVICSEFGVLEIEMQGALTSQFKAIVSDILSWPEGQIHFDVATCEHSHERFLINAAEFILEVGIEAGYLTQPGSQPA